MKAAYIASQGGPEVLEYGDLPDPKPGPGEILVDIHAASVNGADWKVRSGAYAPIKEFPYILGRDFSGVVAALGLATGGVQVGDPVFGVCDVAQEGAYAEQIAVKADIVAAKPDWISHIDCAALALAGLTALVSVEDTLELKAGETILIHGGAGGVASFAVQLAKHIGARVLTTARAENHAYVQSLGADLIIDYEKEDFVERAGPCDAVFDTVGGDVASRSIAALKPGGRAAFIASGAQAPPPARDDVIALRPKVGRDRPHLERILELVAAGAVQAPEVTSLALTDAVKAHRISESRHLRGKMVFAVR